jgi:hypothetical protein
MPKKKTDINTPLPAAKPAPKARATRAASSKVAKAKKPNGASAKVPKVQGPSYHEIAEAAYLRYVSRGGTAGSDFDDWLEAERELSQRYTEAEG